MALKEFKYRGKTIDELKKMSLKEVALLLPSRERRKINAGFTEQEKIFLEKLQSKQKKVKTHCRDMIVLPVMVGRTVGIHAGKEFKDVEIIADMIGHRLGEFALTRSRVAHNAPGIGATKSSASLSVK
ncbi:30S ribosomal protein S19 [Candidatus Woesearchaeota archaeon]|nr:30S ribosomal protein S19 [Candidatus Woesearchaeota archaeon]